MKTTVLIFTLSIFPFFLIQAQESEAEILTQIYEIKGEIAQKLNAIKSEYDRDAGMDSPVNKGKLGNWGIVEESGKQSAIYIFHYPTDYGGFTEEIRIDLSKIGRIHSGKSNYGKEAIFFYTADGEYNAIQMYSHSKDWDLNIGGFRYENEEIYTQATLHCSIDEELVTLFRSLALLTKKHSAMNPSNYVRLNPFVAGAHSAEQAAPIPAGTAMALEVFDALSETYWSWEFTGLASLSALRQYEIDWDSWEYERVDKYEVLDARLNFQFGAKHFRFDIAPVGFSWITLPTYTKYGLSGEPLEVNDFGTVRYYSPSVGFTYSFYSKSNEQEYRDFEFPLSVNFAPLFFPKTSAYKQESVVYDNPFREYFAGLPFQMNASLGANLFFSDSFGIGITAGGTYLAINETSSELTETIDDVQRDFTYRFDKLDKILPQISMKIILRY